MTPSRNKNGFTLLEVIIALTILAVGIMAVVELFNGSLRQARFAAEHTTVAQVVQGAMSDLKAGGVEELVVNWAPNNLSAEPSGNLANYVMYDHYYSTVQRVADVAGLYRVTLTVVLGDGREDTFVTYVTEL